MTCWETPQYVPHSIRGITHAISQSDGYSVAIEWTRAYANPYTYSLAYNIYYSSVREEVFTEGVKFVSPSQTNFATIIQELTPGDTYFFAVRATQYDATWYDLSLLPDAPDLKLYPEGILLHQISASDGYVPVSDLETFPSYGVVQIGSELIKYTGKNSTLSHLTGVTRGFLDSNIRMHRPDGYDGVYTHDNSLVVFFKGQEDDNVVVAQETPSFFYPKFAFTNADGYKEVEKDILTTDLGGTDESFGATSVADGGTSDASQEAFPAYDFAGWHRTDPTALLRGDCLGTYYGGEHFCADGYNGVGRQIRGIPIDVENARRQELLLELTGEPVVLVRKSWTGIRCSCFLPNSENPDDRCKYCYGTGFVIGYEQFYNPRRSDGRILVRFGPTSDDLKYENAGLESSFIPDCWTLVVPAVKDRDFIIRFNEDGTEEFRYEILDVTRNKLFNTTTGAQKFRAQRVRKTDPIYQFRAFRNTATMPEVLTTAIGMLAGPNGSSIPHTHVIIVNEGVTSLSQINQITSDSAGHRHTVVQGIVQEVLGHSHNIILP